MRNLAGDAKADSSVRDELGAAGIQIVDIDPSGEVSTKYAGRLGPFAFYRKWYYWTVIGTVPKSVAEEMYQHPDGVHDVRVEGHCGAPPPEKDVHSYHIDTDAGLRLFADTIRRHGLDRAPNARGAGGAG